MPAAPLPHQPERRSRANRCCWSRIIRPTRSSRSGWLQRQGYQVTLAEHGAEALHLLKTLAFDVVLMDADAGHVDGLEATRRIREPRRQRGHKHHPIIAMTAGAIVGDREKCLAAGMDDYISKPIAAPLLFASSISGWDDNPAMNTRWKPSVTVAAIIERDGRYMLVEEHTPMACA